MRRYLDQLMKIFQKKQEGGYIMTRGRSGFGGSWFIIIIIILIFFLFLDEDTNCSIIS